MSGRTVLITGASDGIGAAAARLLAPKGHRLLLVGRSREKTEKVARDTGAEHFVADFARLDDVRALAGQIADALGDDRIDVLANNAGGVFGDPTPTVDGHEKTMQVNHLAPFLLTNLLMPQLRAGHAAVINTSSVGNRLFGHIDVDDLDNRRDFSANKAYGDAKLANILFTRSLHRRYHDDGGISSVAFHPGNVRTNFAADSTSLMRFGYQTPLRHLVLISADRGGANLEWFIEGTPGSTWQSGAYYNQRKVTDKVNPQASDPDLAEALWKRSAEIVGL
jgi:NAD(P)-dependent dehydrogenase (short-subunit alcohol dehydrogenase family)